MTKATDPQRLRDSSFNNVNYRPYISPSRGFGQVFQHLTKLGLPPKYILETEHYAEPTAQPAVTTTLWRVPTANNSSRRSTLAATGSNARKPRSFGHATDTGAIFLINTLGQLRIVWLYNEILPDFLMSRDWRIFYQSCWRVFHPRQYGTHNAGSWLGCKHDYISLFLIAVKFRVFYTIQASLGGIGRKS